MSRYYYYPRYLLSASLSENVHVRTSQRKRKEAITMFGITLPQCN